MIAPDITEWQKDLDAFNARQGGVSRIEVAWHPKKSRWQIFAVPISDSFHPLAKNDMTKKLCSKFPDDSGREGVLLFTWCERDERGQDCGYMPLDNRVFETLKYADTFEDKHHFEKTIKNPELAKEARDMKTIRSIMGGAQEYWKGLDSLVISMNPDVKASGDWRGARARWR